METTRALFAAAGLVLSLAAHAGAPACPDPRAHAFDFWLGSWDVDNVQRNPAAPEDPTFHPTGQAVVRVYAAAGGCAVIEHWQGSLVWGEVHGFSLRAWDPDTERWTLVLDWPLPRRPVSHFTTLQGTFEHGRGTFTSESTRPDGTEVLTRFTFSDIAPDRYRWDSASSTDGGVSFTPAWIMRATRRPAGAAPVDPDSPAFTVPDPPLCPEPEHRALDPFLGHWEGTAEVISELPVEVDVRAILGGCALLETWRLGEEEAVTVRAWDADLGRWVAWHVSSDHPAPLRLEGPEGGGPVFGFDEGDKTVRESWTRKGKKAIWAVEESMDGGATWTGDLRAVLRAVPVGGP